MYEGLFFQMFLEKPDQRISERRINYATNLQIFFDRIFPSKKKKIKYLLGFHLVH